MLFTDTVSSTELRVALGDRVAEDVRVEHDALLNSTVARHDGLVTKSTGDGVMAVFESAAAAVAAAIAMQQALERFRSRAGVPLHIRIGLSAGDVSITDDDVHGIPVIEAARLEAAAPADGILVADVVRVLAGSRIDAEFKIVAPLELKGLPAPVACARVAWETVPDPDQVPLPTSLATSLSALPFVGRKDERRHIDEAWMRAAAGERIVTLISGEAGIGKTRLSGALAQDLHRDGALVLFGRCDDGLSVPYQPFVEALRHYVDHIDAADLPSRLGRWPGELARLLPELAERAPDLPTPLTADEETQRYRLFEAVSSWLDAAGADGTLFVLDDIQWAAPATLLMLRHVLRTGSRRMLLVATLRSGIERAELTLADIERDVAVVRVELRGLDSSSVEQALRASVAPDLVDGDLAARVTQASGGNAFFVSQLIASWQQEECSLDLANMPAGVRDAVTARLASLTSSAREVIDRAAVVGLEFDVAVLDHWNGVATTTSCIGALDDLVAASLVAEPAAGRFTFTHALVPSAILERLGPTRCAQLSAEALLAYESLQRHGSRYPGADLARLAVAAQSCGPEWRERAVSYSTAAGDEATAQLAHEAALAHYDVALEALSDEDERRPRLMLRIARIKIVRSEFDDGRAILGAAADLVPDSEARLLAEIALAYHGPARVEEPDAQERVLLERAIAALGESDALSARARLHAHLADALTTADPKAHDAAERALRLAEESGDTLALYKAHGSRFWFGFVDPTALGMATTDASDSLAAADRLGDADMQLQALQLQYLANKQCGDQASAETALRRAETLAEATGSPWYRAVPVLLAAREAASAGELAAAENLTTRVLELGGDTLLSSYGSQIIELRRWQGRWQDGLEMLDIASATVGPSIENIVRASRAAFLAAIQSGSHDDEARQAIADALQRVASPATWQRQVEAVLVALATTELGAIDHAAEVIEILRPWDGLMMQLSLPVDFGPAALHIGRLEFLLGDLDAAYEHLARAVEACDRVGNRVYGGLGRAALSRVLTGRRNSGDLERASQLASEARQVATTSGLVWVLRELDRTT